MIAAVLDLLAFLAAGVVLGTLTFGDRRLSLGHPMLRLLAGTLARLAAVLAAFLLLEEGHWARLLAGALGFVAAWIHLTHEA